MVHRTLLCLVMLTALQGSFARANAQSIAASLSSYKKTLSVTSVAGITATSLSGLALQLPNRALYAVDNDNANVYELTVTGTVVRTITTQGITDPEGIGHFHDNTFFIAEEGNSRILRVEIPAAGAGPLNWSSAPALQLATNWGNTGVEGVSYCRTNNTLYAVKEISPPRLYRITLDDSGGFLSAYENDPFNIEDHEGDAADIFALNDGNFIIDNQERNRLEGYGPTGNLLSTLSVGMNKPEGIAIDTTDGTIYMVGEPREFSVFKRSTRDLSPGSSSKPGFSISIASTGMRERPLAAMVTLPRRAPVTIDCILLDGRDFRLYESILEVGSHELRPLIRRLPQGISLLRFSAGPYRRVIRYALP
jgi:uncharacterized protein YjiK